MSPPLPITEDTPPDMLAGAMDLQVILPNGQKNKMSVERSTPMMDLLVQITTTNKISPGGHVIQAIDDRGVLPYKPSTPIGALDTWTVRVVPKKQTSNAYYKKAPSSMKPANINTPFEQTFRLQVNLPRNQLYVSRVSYKTRLEDILREVCVEKNLDQSKYCLVNPENLSEELNLSGTFLECKLQRITLLSKNNRPVGLSSVDIMALKRYENGGQRVNNNYASHSYDGSISSGSLEGRSLSPIRSDESSCSPTIPKTNGIAIGRPIRKRRPAPKPPSSTVNTTNGSTEKKATSETLTMSHSRNSSDSSGYHESSVLSESPESNVNSLPDSLPRRCKLPSTSDETTSTTTNLRNGKMGGCLSRSLSNLAVVENGKKSNTTFFASGIKSKAYSASSTSLASCGGKRKKAPAPPPPSSKSLLSLKEEDAPLNSDHYDDNDGPPSYSSSSGINEAFCRKAQTLPAASSVPSIGDRDQNADTDAAAEIRRRSSATDDDRLAAATPDSTASGSSSNTVDCRSLDHHLSKPSLEKVADSAAVASAAKNDSKEHELTMDDDEIDRIFEDATKGCEYPSSSTLSSPAASIVNEPTSKAGDDDDKIEVDNTAYSWQYKLPSCAKDVRDRSTAGNDSSEVNVDDSIGKSTTAADSTGERRLLIEKTDTKRESFRVRVDSGWSSKAEDEDLSSSSASSTLSKSSPEKAAPPATTLILNYDSTYTSSANNDSGLGSDDSIPSMAEPTTTTTTKTAPPTVAKVKSAQPCRRRGSNLENFCITTYQNTKPTEIFHDDSVKTSKTTQLAKNSRPAFSKPEERSEDAAFSRRGSFKEEKSPASCAIKRSKSHISVLSGNYAKFNKYGKLTTAMATVADVDSSASCENLSSMEDVYKSIKYKSLPSTIALQLKRSSSEFVVSKDTNKEEDELLELRDQVVKWKENEKMNCVRVRNSAELQSLQVLKDILPQINKSQKQNNPESAPAGHSLSCVTATTKSRTKIEPKCERSSVVADGGRVPTVNLQSWNDRPRSQVSIKTDRDYVYGLNKKFSPGNASQTVSETCDKVCDGRLEARTNANRVDDAVSHVPVVRAVEFKKPFIEPSAPVANVGNGSTTDDVAKRARPNSCYLFGEQPSVSAYGRETDGRNAARNRQTLPDARSKPNEMFTLRTYSEQMAEKEATRKGESNKRCQPRTDDWHQKRATIAATLELRATPQIPPPPVSPAPPPPLPAISFAPCLKPAANRRTTSCPKLTTGENARDILLFSIKNFNRDNLRKLRVK